jgi:carbon monoxide dehydrogenase subunit G
MKLENELTVPASVDEAWKVLLDVERVAPCLPGATIESSEGESFQGTMKVKIGPIAATYNGTIEIAEADEAARRAVMRAKARDAKGRGSAEATITSTMAEVSEGTRVTVQTDMRVTGPPAQFGRGVMEEVSAKLMDRFADCLATQMAGGEAAEAPTAPEVPTAAPLPGDVPAPPPSETEVRLPGGGTAPLGAERPTEEVLDLGELSGGAVMKRVLPSVAGIALAVAVAVVVLRRRRR